jgi:hypothetical protein
MMNMVRALNGCKTCHWVLATTIMYFELLSTSQFSLDLFLLGFCWLTVCEVHSLLNAHCVSGLSHGINGHSCVEAANGTTMVSMHADIPFRQAMYCRSSST